MEKLLWMSPVIALQIWYWGFYFPRAWRDRSNPEIEDLRAAFRLMRDNL